MGPSAQRAVEIIPRAGVNFSFSEDKEETWKENPMPPTPILAPCPHWRVKRVRKSPFMLLLPPDVKGNREVPPFMSQ